jgi:hypothetical protein
MRLAITSILLLGTAFAASGCLVHTTGADDDSPSDPSDPADPSDPPPSIANGPYAMTSNVEITIEALLPEPAANLVATLRDFSHDPAHTLLDVCEDAGVPAVGTIRDYLPGFLEDKLEGWINDEINRVSIAGVPVPQFAGSVVALAETTLSQVNIESTLTIDGNTAMHQLSTLDLAPAGLDLQLALGGVPDEIISATTTVSSRKQTLTIGDHMFSIAYGHYAWQAIQDTLVATYGADLRGLLGAAMSCPSIAHTVANKCMFSQCVGHEAELTTICERGLDEVVSRAKAKLESFRFDALHLHAGTATMVDANHDRLAESLTNGVWTAEINAGQGLRPAPATFTATR